MILEDIISAQEDFDEVLSSETQTPLEALEVLRSYDLSRAPVEELRIFIDIFSSYLQSFTQRTGLPLIVRTQWQQSETLLAYLRDDFLRSHAPLAAQAQNSWTAAVVDIVTNSAHSSCEVHLNRLSATQPWAYASLDAVMERMRGRESSQVGERDTYTSQGTARALVYLCAVLPSSSLGTTAEEEFFQEGRGGIGSTPSLASKMAHILSTLVVPSTATCSADYCISLQAIFQATFESLQTSILLTAVDAMSKHEQKSCYQRLWDLVSSPRYHCPPSQDAWWGVFASVCHQLARQVNLTGSLDSNLAAVAGVFFNETSAIMLIQCLLANPSTATKGLNGMKGALDSANKLLGHCPGAFISACCELLAPEVNAPMATRLEALNSIKGVAQTTAQLSTHDDGDGDEESSCAALWNAQAIQRVLFCISRDPSVRVRRKAMDVLHQIASKSQALEEELPRLIAATSMRCRDQDAQVRKVAYSTLEDLTKNFFEAVLEVLSVYDWRRIFEHGLSAAASAEGGGTLGKHEKSIAECTPRLLKRYLRQCEDTKSLMLCLQNLIQDAEHGAASIYFEALGDIISVADLQEVI